ncbi:alcohol oxidase [Artomyces pyxidatus]|uniref:Alcohol oxidase n=1 Tax=Artomyces pyxidatus TaxID=48021 RepID=A0ACB8SYW3_9AGAM|nr:alcohol oxidase [Artomyces pyxidatus]
MSPTTLTRLLTAAVSLSATLSASANLQPQYNGSYPAATGTDAASFAKTKFDFVVVGGGTAGLVLAYRLSENPKISVGVIEAGQYRPDDPLIGTPTAGNLLGNADIGTLLGNPTYDWMFQSVPQAALNGLVIDYPRGKVVGGSSAINSMIWQRASDVDYDNWNTVFQNGPGWSAQGLEPYFKRVESWTEPELLFPGQQRDPALATAHGTNGPISVSYDTFLTDIEVPSVAAANSIGIPTNSNPDGGNETFIALTARSVDPKTGLRSYAGNAYYQTAIGRPNLKLLSQAVVSKINFSKSGKSGIVATGVNYIVGGKTYTVSVEKEVILAAGSLKTPQILELSGVGNKTILSNLGIDVLLDFPQIGENLQDHPVTLLDFKVKDDVLTLDRLNYNQTYSYEQQVLYNTSASGAMSYTEAVVGPLPLQKTVNSSTFDAMFSNLTATLATQQQTPIQKVQYAALESMVKSGAVGWFELTVVPSGGVASTAANGSNYLTSVAIELDVLSSPASLRTWLCSMWLGTSTFYHRLTSAGQHINSTDPTAQPVIDPKFLEIPWDAEVLVHGSQWVRKWMQSEPIAGLLEGEVTPSLNVQSDEEWDAYVRTAVRTTNHPLGTTAMASRALGGVVDPNLKVYGLANVRVVDAGIIPMTIGVAIQSTIYAMAEKAADLVKSTYGI